MTELSPWVRKLAACGLLICLVALLWSALLLPLWRWSSSSLEMRNDIYFELSRANRTLELNRHMSAERIAMLRQTVSSQLVPGSNEAEAITHIQTLLDRLLKEHGLALEAIQAAGPQSVGALTRLSVDVRANAPERNVFVFLTAVEQAMPMLRIERLVLRGTNGANMDTQAPGSHLVMEASISAHWHRHLLGAAQ